MATKTNTASLLAQQFTEEEVVVILEAARIALADGEVFDDIAEKTDIADDEMARIRDKFHEFLDRQ